MGEKKGITKDGERKSDSDSCPANLDDSRQEEDRHQETRKESINS